MSEFQATQQDGIHLITCPEMIDSKMAKDVEVLIKTWMVVPVEVHILDMKETMAIDLAAFRPFVLFSQSLRNSKKALYSINVSPKISNLIRQNGLTSVFNAVGSIEEAKRKMKATTSDRPAIDVEIINPFIMATKTVLETQASLALTACKPFVKKSGDEFVTEIAGVISLHCSEFRGSIALCFPKKVFLGIYEKMVGEKHEEINSEIEDAAGELLNIIFGQSKTVLNDQKGYNLEKALPTILTGDKLKVHHQSPKAAIVLPFESAVGTFRIEILIDPV